jgi:hypothetical protein
MEYAGLGQTSRWALHSVSRERTFDVNHVYEPDDDEQRERTAVCVNRESPHASETPPDAYAAGPDAV